MLPEMTEHGYDKRFSATLVACAGCIGIIIPPSLAFVMYGVVTNTSISDLFLAGIIPGLLMTLGLCVVSYFAAKKNGWGASRRASLREVGKAFWEAKWSLLAPVIILGGIYSGIFTPTESAVVSIAYAFVIGMFVNKELTWKELYKAIVDTMILNGMVLFLLGASTAFSKYVSLAKIPTLVVNFITGITKSPIIILLLMNIFLLIVGCLIDNLAAITILAPILLPVATAAGLNAVQFGAVLALNTTIGLITPPYGPNLFIGASIAKIKMEDMLKALVPQLICLIIVLMIITYFPGITTVFLRN